MVTFDPRCREEADDTTKKSHEAKESSVHVHLPAQCPVLQDNVDDVQTTFAKMQLKF